MGDACSPKNQAAVIAAKLQAEGKDIFTEAQRVNQMNAERRAYYEQSMANDYGLKPGPKKMSAWDAARARKKQAGFGKDRPNNIFDNRLYAPPSEMFSKKFYGAIDKKITAWAKGKNATIETYREQVGKPTRQLLKAIDGIIKEGGSKAAINGKLAKFGLKADNVYDARDYLSWLEKGGHLKSQGDANVYLKQAGKLAKAQANLNLTWTLGNGVDAIRVMSHYLTRKNGIPNTIKGLYDFAKATKGIGAFSKLKGLEKQGVYDSVYQDRGQGGSGPFEWSINAQKNLAYHLDKAAGGNGTDGIRETLFDYKPWDRPRYDRFEGSGLVFGLARYPINEIRWMYGTTKKALSGDVREAANLGTFFLTRAAMTGATSLVPAPLWAAMPEDMKESIVQFEKEYGLNLIKIGSREAFEKMGIEAELDLSGYTQPGGGSLGSRAGQLWTSASGIASSAGNTAVNAAQGKLDAAAAHAVATGLSLANFGAFAGSVRKLAQVPGIGGAIGKAVPSAEALEGSQLNSTTLTKLFKTVGEELEKEFEADRFARNVTKAVIGESIVKKAQ